MSTTSSPGSSSTASAGFDASRHVFATTHWSRVATAAGRTPEAAAALNELCQAYWHPIYAFVRRSGWSPHDAQDLTQGFFAHLLASEFLSKADPLKGRFRSFLLGSVKHFLAHEWEKARAQKRGGAIQLASLGWDAAETQYLTTQATTEDPESVFDRQWATTLLGRVLDQLLKDYEAHNRGGLYHALKGTLSGERPEFTYRGLAEQLGLSEGALKVAAHRLRRRYRELLRAEIAQTLNDPGEIDAELRHLFSALGGN